MKLKHTPTVVVLASVLAIPAAHSANLAILFQTAGVSQLGNYDTANPGVAPVPVTIFGLAANETLNSIDYRANGGGVYGISSLSNIYTITTTVTPTATLLGSLSPALAGSADAFDFNPAASGGILARIISGDTQNNRVIDSTTGSYFGPPDKTPVFFAAGDFYEVISPTISHIAYNNNVAGATTTQQFGIGSDINALVTIDNNAGTLNTVAPLSLGGSILDATADGGFDIDESGVAYAGFTSGTVSNVYTIDTTNGRASLVGSFAGNLVGLTAIPVPEPSTGLLAALAGLGLILRRRK